MVVCFYRCNEWSLVSRDAARAGFVSEDTDGKHKVLKVGLKYTPTGEGVIAGIKRVSKPGQRIYMPADRLPRTNSGYGLTIISTSKGLMTDRQARKAKMGGEVVCQVW